MLMHTEIRQTFTNGIVEHLESGKVAPWRRHWTLDRNAGAPANVVSKRSYSGINPLVLEVASMRYGFQSKWWATINQWRQLGARVMRRPDNVKPGQWATNIVFWKPVARMETDANGYEREEKYYLLKTFHVFCVDQVEGKHLDHLLPNGWRTMPAI